MVVIVIMQIGVITLFPEMFQALYCGGVAARALERGLLQLHFWNPRDFTTNKHRCVDDRPYGGGPGMVMQVQPVRAAIQAAKTVLGTTTSVIYLSPQGQRLDQKGVNYLGQQQNLILLAGRYEGIDERIISRDVDEEWSIGDYVLSGGELPAMVVIDALVRHLPGALGHQDSAAEDSFFNGLLDHPHYSRPEVIDGDVVPKILLMGNHAEIARWRLRQALERTWHRRPDLLEKLHLTTEQQQLLNECISDDKDKIT
jgi:tRNA (guanine37-N1)-methyltransferase